MKTLKYLISFSILAFALQSSAGLLFNYSQLALKDLDQMNAIVMSKIKESKKSSSGKTVPLKEALQAVYSRPNEDGMIEKIVAPLRSELDEHDAWEKVLNELSVEAIDVLKHPKAFKPVVQVTYSIFLENLLEDMKPYIPKEGFERSLAIKIRDAKIELTKEAGNERDLRMMKSTISPSEIAAQLLAAPKAEASVAPTPDEAISTKKADQKTDAEKSSPAALEK